MTDKPLFGFRHPIRFFIYPILLLSVMIYGILSSHGHFFSSKDQKTVKQFVQYLQNNDTISIANKFKNDFDIPPESTFYYLRELKTRFGNIEIFDVGPGTYSSGQVSTRCTATFSKLGNTYLFVSTIPSIKNSDSLFVQCVDIDLIAKKNNSSIIYKYALRINQNSISSQFF